RRCPPSVRIEESFPAFAHRVTVFGSTRKRAATSAGVSSVSPDDWSRFIPIPSLPSEDPSGVPRCPFRSRALIVGPGPERRYSLFGAFPVVLESDRLDSQFEAIARVTPVFKLLHHKRWPAAFVT